jgi:hypothetical protein
VIKIRGYFGDLHCIAGGGGSVRKPDLQKCFHQWEKFGPGVRSEEGYFERGDAKL